jgi:hypothetical protein
MSDSDRKFVGRVRIMAHTQLDVPHLWRAGRHFPTKGYKEVEVLEQEEDPPEIITQRQNPNSGIMQDIALADQTRMGQKSYREILADSRLSVQETVGVSHQIMAAELQSAKAEVQRVSGELVDVKGACARLEAENGLLRARIAELEGTVAVQAADRAPDLAADAPAGDGKKRRSKDKTEEKTAGS